MTIFSALFGVMLAGHVAAGFIGLAAFWVPLFARKGGRAHVLSGRVYEYCAYIVTASALTACVSRIGAALAAGTTVDESPGTYGFPLFLGYLGLATFSTVRHAVRVVQTRKDPATLRRPFHLWVVGWAPGLSSVGLVAFALIFWSGMSPLMLALAPIGVVISWATLVVVHDPRGAHMRWFYSHLGSMLAGGIAFHTAFIVFGFQQIFPYEMEGSLGLLPWVVPTLLGLPAIVLWNRYYRRRFAPQARA